MLRLFAAVALLGLGCTIAQAGTTSVVPTSGGAHPTFMVGIAVEFGDTVEAADVGITAKVLSSAQPNQLVFGAGVAYFPWAANQFGIDVDVGFNFEKVGALVGYDLLREKLQLSVGFVPTDGSQHCPDGSALYSDLCYYSPSDRRLKRNVRLLATLESGIRIYSFKYLWSDVTYVGVMAQDLLEDSRFAAAVVTADNGFYAVDYARIGLSMVTMDEYRRHGLAAIVHDSLSEHSLAA